eukprot:403365099
MKTKSNILLLLTILAFYQLQNSNNIVQAANIIDKVKHLVSQSKQNGVINYDNKKIQDITNRFNNDGNSFIQMTKQFNNFAQSSLSVLKNKVQTLDYNQKYFAVGGVVGAVSVGMQVIYPQYAEVISLFPYAYQATYITNNVAIYGDILKISTEVIHALDRKYNENAADEMLDPSKNIIDFAVNMVVVAAQFQSGWIDGGYLTAATLISSAKNVVMYQIGKVLNEKNVQPK